LYCINCLDIVKLSSKTSTCKCNQIGGRYLGNRFAVYYGKYAIPLGIENSSFTKAVKLYLISKGEAGLVSKIFTIDNKTLYFKKVTKKEYYDTSNKKA
jgi:hypothetical protein